ncbi:hypothetical protein [Halosimplex pelagicum]|uniref:Uncharacterized protein n=1 Tax=Halosimplex pelagicum TaxID=869886 RepID=A0A7D5TD31_9EURY|nr:hypothetical protein [Halosimplex pelagicum]QLH82615.1 hypothetical protein HZS54_13735 [Halosimplex pelagicum]
MTARRPTLLAVAALLVCSGVGAVAVGPANAAPPPESVCGVCGDGLADAAENEGIRLTVEYGTATIRVREDGSGHWDARVRIDDDAADRLAANATLRERVVRASLDRRTVVEDPRNLRTSVVNDTLVVTFDQPGVAHRSLGGVVLVDLLDPRARRAGLDLDADQLRIEGPNGTVVSRAPSAATVENGAVVWRVTDEEPGLGSDTRLAFAPSDGPAARALTTVGFVAFSVGVAEPSALALGVAPAALLGALLLAVRRWGDELPAVDPLLLSKAITGSGAAVAVLAGAALAGSVLLDAAVAETVATFAALYALVAAGAAVLDRPSARAALGWTLGASALVALAASVVSVVALQTALLSIPAALWFPLGRAGGRDRGVTVFVVVALLAAPFGAAVLYVPWASPLLGLLLSAFTTIPWAAATVAFGVPLYLLGRGPDDAADRVEADDRTDPASAD